MNWGNKIFLAFVLFAAYIITLVVVCVKQDFYLVSPDYYNQEIAYQDQIERQQNLAELEARPELQFSRSDLLLTLDVPKEQRFDGLSGTIHLFRPSDAGKDVKLEIKLPQDQGKSISLNDLQKGLWRVKFNWSWDGKEFYQEKIIVI